jgi:hypothetical protein
MKDMYNFFVQEGTSEASDIEEIVNCLDPNKGEYRVNYLKTDRKNGHKLPMLELTFTTGETCEYVDTEMFRIILNVTKIGIVTKKGKKKGMQSPK